MSRRRTWFDLEERGVLWGMRLVLAAHRLLGRRLCLWLINLVVFYYWLSNATARRASRDYLRRLSHHAPHLGLSGGARDSLRHFNEFATAMIDKLGAWQGDIGADRVDMINTEALRRVLASGRGALLVGAHLGNLEVSRAISEVRPEVRLNVLVHTHHAEKFNQLLNEVSGDARLSLIQVSSLNPATAIMLQQRIEQGELVVIMGDRVPLSGAARTTRVPFLGAPAPFPQGPFILAALLRCPVLSLFCVRRGERFELTFNHLTDQVVLPRKQRDQELDRQVRRFVGDLERHCLAAPLQWFNFYDFWQQDTQEP
ncbi:MAG: lipid A biosynthesis acyltransferase [Alcanivorax sp.]|nr:lipid A biosynthesis acyltransferase [Alcanivorax sp.]